MDDVGNIKIVEPAEPLAGRGGSALDRWASSAFMKHGTFPVIAALAVWLLTGCSKSSNDVQIVSAVYGEYTNFADVTYRVRDLIRLNTGFQVSPSFLQADPFFGYHKVLVIVYDVKGQRHIVTAYEDHTVSATTLLQAAGK